IKMLSPDEGWLLVRGSNDTNGGYHAPAWSLLLHYQQGTWSRVTVPISDAWDFAPVGPDELWVVGPRYVVGPGLLPTPQDSILAHYRAGHWTTTPAPSHVLLSELRLLSPTDGFAVGWHTPDNPDDSSLGPAAVLHFDGAVWKPIQIGANGAAQVG